ncbi:GNAT family N-acetyltransferase [Lysinibacillus sp. NPDC097195]|uniref:GNAT family N-acetyltransferase n=1 Tax=Lysinibacillus sp. NPDC097195 TaxID=3364141 RepID=UPI00380DFD44
MNVELKAITNEDEAFLYKVYRSTRNHEVALWGWTVDQKQLFLAMQWRSQQASYNRQFSKASHSLIVVDKQFVGRLLIEEMADYHHLIDISILPAFQGKGIGSCIIAELLQTAREGNKAVVLQAFHTNPARGLYERLGFQVVSGDELYLKMRWQYQKSSSC